MKKEVDQEPATKEDIKRLDEDLELMGGNLAFQIDEVRGDIAKINERLDTQHETLERHEDILGSILSVLQSISGQLAPIKDAPEKIENHEERITDLEVQARMMRR